MKIKYLSSIYQAALGAMADIANIYEDGKVDDDDDLEVNLKIGMDKDSDNSGEKFNSYIGGKAMAILFEGKVEEKITILGTEIELGETGYAGRLGAEGKFGIVNGKFTVGASVCALFGLGGSISIGLAGKNENKEK